MLIRVRLFAVFRERAGRSEVELELPEGAVVAEALERLQSITERAPAVLALNHEYAPVSAHLHPGDELALIPPVSGGSQDVYVCVTGRPLEPERLLERVSEPRA